ncbi:hypothetical protein E3N88_38053 [Mikania micrantha]|uniref:Uncharacterized protein n=1 Tax=Mikania micrantha TaxID=192012 RepID=A0A5N6LSX7_9ASTR|nr:hypothetical protein E3N88_38053 [Mikania micrantha]
MKLGSSNETKTIVRKCENGDERIKPIKIGLLGSSGAHRGTRWPNKRQCRDTRQTSRGFDSRNPPRYAERIWRPHREPCSSHWKPLKALLKLKNLEEDLLDHHSSLPPSCPHQDPQTRRCRSCYHHHVRISGAFEGSTSTLVA